MYNLINMSIKEIIDYIGIGISESNSAEGNSQITNCMPHYITDKEVLEKFKEMIKKSTTIERKDMISFLIKNEKYIDKRKFILIVSDMYFNNSDKLSPEEEELFKNSKSLLKTEKINDELVYFEIENNDCKIRIISGKEIINGKNKKNLQRLEKIDKENELEVLIQAVQLSDIEDIVCDNKIIGKYLKIITIFAMIKKIIPEMTNETIKDITQNYREYLKKYENELEKLDVESFVIELKKTLLGNANYINIDKLLLISGYRMIQELEQNTEEFRIEHISLAKELLTDIISQLENSKSKITITDSDKDSELRYGLADLKRDMSRFIGNDYMTDERREAINANLFSGQVTLTEVPDEVFSFLNYSNKEIQQLARISEANLKYLIERNKISLKELPEMLTTITYSNEFVQKLYNNKMLNNEQILDLYIKGVISQDNIKYLLDNNQGVEDIITPQKMVEIYGKYVYGIYEKEDQEKFDRTMLLYRTIRMTGKTIEQMKESGDEIIQAWGKAISEDDIKRLYCEGLLTLDNVLEWCGTKEISELFATGKLKPIDTQRLIKEGKISIDSFKAGLRGLTEIEKAVLIFSTFEDAPEIREELIAEVRIGKNQNSQTNNSQQQRGEGSAYKANEYVTDPYLRWKLIKLLDLEYSQIKLTKDGYMVFRLPNQNNSTIIIEKLFNSKAGKADYSYGSATYILSEEEYIKNQEEIIKDEYIEVNELLKLAKEEKAVRFFHSKEWGNNIKKYFSIEANTQYTNEEINKINEIIEQIMRNRKKRER